MAALQRFLSTELGRRDGSAPRRSCHVWRRQFDDLLREHRAAWYQANTVMAPASRAGKQDEATQIFNEDSNKAFEATLAEVMMSIIALSSPRLQRP